MRVTAENHCKIQDAETDYLESEIHKKARNKKSSQRYKKWYSISANGNVHTLPGHTSSVLAKLARTVPRGTVASRKTIYAGPEVGISINEVRFRELEMARKS